MEKNLYDILGVSKNASDADIKKAFKKLSLKWHPDRQGDKSEKEKKEAEEKFKEISGAYSILSDPEKKRQYDMYGTIDQNAFSGGFDFGDIFSSMDDIFGNMFGRNRRSNSYSGPKKGQTIKLNVPVSIDEIINGIDRDVKYDCYVRCEKCNGKGGTGIKECPHCHGTGMITETRRSGFGMIQSSHPCNYCGGKGTIIEHVCPECHGTGLKLNEKTVHIKAKGGFENGHEFYISGMGYESKDGGENGDLYVTLVYQYDASKYVVQGNTVYEKISIPYYDCILGCDKDVIIGNKIKKTIHIPEYSSEGTKITVQKTYDMNVNYVYIVSVKMPTYVRNNEKELLKQLKKLN